MCNSFIRPVGVVVVAGTLLTHAFGASADSLVTDFDSFDLSGTYASWGGATITSGPTSYGVESLGFGGGFFDIDPNLVAPGETTIELYLTVTVSDPVAGLGVVLQLVDEDLTGFNYTQFGLLPTAGVQTITWDIASPSFIVPNGVGADNELNIEDLSFFHIQVDPGTSPDTYSIAFENLRLIGAPTGAIVGDYNSDGFVSQGDLDLVLLNWGDTDAPVGFDEAALDGGGPFDGLISQNELDGVLLNWGDGTPPGAASVPEPAAVASLLLIALAGCRRRKS